MSLTQAQLGAETIKIPCQQVRGNGQCVVGVGRRLELALLYAPYAQFPADALDSINSNENTIASQVTLQPDCP